MRKTRGETSAAAPAGGGREEIRFGSARMTLYMRANGMIALAWSEGGRAMRTTRQSWAEARKWAREKCAQIDEATGARWIQPAAAERMAWLSRLARMAGPDGDESRLLADVEEALGVLAGAAGAAGAAGGAGPARLAAAARWFAAGGPGTYEEMTLGVAADRYIAEYESHHESASARPMRSELRTLCAAQGATPLTEVAAEALAGHVRRGNPAPRTVRNRIAIWQTFFRRAAALGWWPDGRRMPCAALKKPMRPDIAPQVFAPATGLAALRAVAAGMERHLAYLIIAGWLGCRPSECLRLEWRDFDFANRMLHVRCAVAKKTRRERWVPMCAAAAAELCRLARIYARPCPTHARQFVSAFLRAGGVVAEWPADVLRHSYITYRMQDIGSIDRTAEEAGNSAAEIRRSYRRPIRPGEGAAWFAALEEFAADR